eukprot:TRINITY_DN799_c0_g1_i1.p1 TRINITY_DN799_c0_g1~~TRINITY_DN799_c0_g1_i1.p1  ORF type:complete len:536 (+),score=205.93 TRINITY_DN799_c0_g1_i1:59-1666(+)
MDDAALLWGAPKKKKQSQQPPVPTPPPAAAPADAADDTAGDTFGELGLAEWVERTLSGLSIVTPTQIQRRSIPLVLQGKDVCGTACTGSGKTAAYALPILHTLAKDPYGVYACVMAPTREITMQVADQFRIFGATFDVQVLTLVGGVENQPQQRVLERRPPIVVATPGRLKDTLALHDTAKCFRRLKYLVFDEADRLLDESFEETVDEILALLGKARYQLLLFSATLSAEALSQSNQLKRIGWDKRDFTVVDTGETEESIYTSAGGLTELYVFMPAAVKLCYLVNILEGTKQIPWQSAMVFVASCRECEVVRLTLQELGLPVCSINSLLTQKQRMDNLSMFKLGRAKILVGTDVASRGLDIPKVDLVLNYDIPKLSKTYVHRAGRTARAGRSGRCCSLVTPLDIKNLQKIESHVSKKFDCVRLSEEKCNDLLDVVVAARTRAKLSVNQNFGERLRENEARRERAPRDLRREAKQEAASHAALAQRRRTKTSDDTAPTTEPQRKRSASTAAVASGTVVAKKKKKVAKKAMAKALQA